MIRVTETIRIAVIQVMSANKMTSRNMASNQSGAMGRPGRRFAGGEIRRHGACNGFVTDFGSSDDWTLLRHRSSDAANGVGGQ